MTDHTNMRGYSTDASGSTYGMFYWNRSARGWGWWRVSGFVEFTHAGYAVMDDFGSLVQVP